jgi:23S rRNA C2498 (ribose-2'-O)-methylase RlmM
VNESEAVFGDDLLAVDVGAAPGGETGYLANFINRRWDQVTCQ